MEEEGITPEAEAPGNAPLSVEDGTGASAIHAALFGKPGKAMPDDEDEPEQAQADEAVSEGGDEPSETDDEETDAPDKPEPKFVLEDGTEVTRAEIEEWRRGQLRQSDYTRKTQELAEQRRQFEQRQAEIAQKAQAYEERANIALAALSQRLPPKPDMQMWRDDPIGAAQQQAEHDAVMAEYQRIQDGLRQHHEGKQAEQLSAFTEYKAKEATALLQKRPELRDNARAEQVGREIQQYILPHYGFQPDEMSSLYDHRVADMLMDLIEYRKLKAQAPKATQKAETAAPVVKSGTRQSAADSQARALRDAKARLRKSGSMEDGAAAIELLLSR